MTEREQVLLSQLAQLNSSATPSDIQLMTSDLTSYFTELAVERDSSQKQLETVNAKYNQAVLMNGELLARIPVENSTTQTTNDNVAKQKEDEDNEMNVKDIAQKIVKENDL